MPRLTILHISTRLILGGSQENTVLSCEGQARLGHRVHLAFGPIYGPEGSHLGRVLGFNDGCRSGTVTRRDGETACGTIVTHELPDLIREIDPARDRAGLEQLERLIREVDPDIVHTHSSKAGILGRVAAWRSRITRDGRARRPGVVHTIHGPPFMPTTGPIAARLKTRIKNAAYALAERIAARRCHVIVSVADAMTEQFRARGIGRREQYVTVRSGMETAEYLSEHDTASIRSGLGFEPGHVVFGTVARLAEHKGHDDIIDALGPVMREHPEWRLLWVGDGWWRERLEQRLEQAGIRERVVLTGLVDPEFIPRLMHAVDVLIHPSEREGLPRTVPQAMLAARPTIATDVDGTREACIDDSSPIAAQIGGPTGILVPVNDPGAIRAAALRLAGSPELRREMGERGRAFAREAFDHEVMVDRLEEVYARARALAQQH